MKVTSDPVPASSSMISFATTGLNVQHLNFDAIDVTHFEYMRLVPVNDFHTCVKVAVLQIGILPQKTEENVGKSCSEADKHTARIAF